MAADDLDELREGDGHVVDPGLGEETEKLDEARWPSAENSRFACRSC